MSRKRVKLKELLTQPVQNGYSPVCPKKPTGKWVLSLGALNGIGFDATQKKPAPIKDTNIDKYLLEPGDFLISRSNTLDKVGRSALFMGGIDNCSYPDLMMRFRVDESRVFPRYLDLFLKSSEAIRHFQRYAAGSSGSMKKISKSVVEDLDVPLPSLEEQKKIAYTLSAWDQAVTKTEKLILAKEKQYNYLLDKLIIKPNFERKRIRSFTEEVLLRNCDCSIRQVLSITNTNGFISPSELFNRKIASEDLHGYKIVCKGYYAYNPSRINVGSIARLDRYEIAVLSPMYVVFSIDEDKVVSDYFLHWLSSQEARRRIRNSAQGSVRNIVNYDSFGAISVPVPILKEQHEIAVTLNLAQREIQLYKQLLAGIQNERLWLIQKLLSN